jgi:hypothetical protein
MDWITVAVAVVLGIIVALLTWQTSPAIRRVQYRQGVGWYFAWSDTTAMNQAPSYGRQDHTAPVPARSIRLWTIGGVVLVAAVPLLWLASNAPILAVVSGLCGLIFLGKAVSASRRDRLTAEYRSIGEAAKNRFDATKRQ